MIAAAQKAIDNTRSIGIGLSACTIPANGKPNFSVADGQMEVGIGHHGEPGISVQAIRPAREMADLMLDTVLPDLPFAGGDDLAVLVSGLGATPVMELYILYDRIAEVLEGRARMWPPVRRQPVHLAGHDGRHADGDAAGRGA